MVWKTKLFVGLLTIFTIWLGWKYFTRPEMIAVQPPPLPAASATPLPTRAPATPEDIAQLLAVPVTISGSRIATSSANMQFAIDKKVGFVTIFGENIASSSAQRLISQIKAETGALIAVDHEGGSVQRLDGAGFTKLAALKTICSQEESLRKASFATTAAELRQAGVDIVFGPVVDLASDNAILKDRICSSDPTLTAAVAFETIDAYTAQGILPVIKHYPGIGSTTNDLHDEIDALLEEPPELSLYKTILELKPKIGVMSTHVLVKNLSENAPCSLSFDCILLLNSYSSQSLLFTDALEMESALTGTDFETKKNLIQVSREAILAGNHILVYGPSVREDDLEQILEILTAEYDTNVVLRQKIDQALTRLDAVQAELAKQRTVAE